MYIHHTDQSIVLYIHFRGYSTTNSTFLLTAKPQTQTNKTEMRKYRNKFKQQALSVTFRKEHVRWFPRRSDSKQGPLDDKKTIDQAYSGSTELFSFWKT